MEWGVALLFGSFKYKQVLDFVLEVSLIHCRNIYGMER